MRLSAFLLIALWSSITAAEDFLELEIQNGQVVAAYIVRRPHYGYDGGQIHFGGTPGYPWYGWQPPRNTVYDSRYGFNPWYRHSLPGGYGLHMRGGGVTVTPRRW